MSPPLQPTYSSADGYVSEQFFTLFFDLGLDAAHPPAPTDFSVQINGTGTAVTEVTVDGAAKTVVLAFTANALTTGDIIEFSYTDPTGNNDVNAVQGRTGRTPPPSPPRPSSTKAGRVRPRRRPRR